MTEPTGPNGTPSRLGDSRALAKVVRQMGTGDGTPKSLAARRRMVAGYFRMLGQQLNGESTEAAAPTNGGGGGGATDAAKLPRRLRQTLERLLQGDGEKQIALKLGLSQHTVHVYVKSLHKRFKVSSRAELLARFIQPGALPSHEPPPAG